MFNNKFLMVAILIGIFVSMGDKFAFMPKPVQKASYDSRVFLVGLWPSWLKPKTSVYERTNKAIDETNNPKTNP
ncbi:MAG: hypothetical protein ACRC2J_08205 [Microcoleaceae cyanobacterium]